MVTGKGRNGSVAPEKLGIERGDTPKGYDARFPVEFLNKREWGSW